AASTSVTRPLPNPLKTLDADPHVPQLCLNGCFLFTPLFKFLACSFPSGFFSLDSLLRLSSSFSQPLSLQLFLSPNCFSKRLRTKSLFPQFRLLLRCFGAIDRFFERPLCFIALSLQSFHFFLSSLPITLQLFPIFIRNSSIPLACRVR